jgi:quinol monooxygenase YgiN
MTAPLVCIASIVARPGHETQVRAALLAMLPPTRAETGCLRYELNGVRADPARFVMVEQWQDQAAFDAHCASPHFKALAAQIGPIAALDIQLFEALG